MDFRNPKVEDLGSESESRPVLQDPIFNTPLQLSLWILMMGYTFMFFACMSLIGYLHWNRQRAYGGEIGAARKVILPAFEPLLWLLGIVTGAMALVLIAQIAQENFSSLGPVTSEVFYSGRQFVLCLPIVFLFETNLCIKALLRASLITLVMSSWTIPVIAIFIATMDKTSDKYFVWRMVIRRLILLFFLYVFIRPPGRANRKTIRIYCAFALIYHTLRLLYQCIARLHLETSSSVLAVTTVVWMSLDPVFIWFVLRADTDHWRGIIGRSDCPHIPEATNRLLDEYVAAQCVHEVLETHRVFAIDFSRLRFHTRIAAGGHSHVFEATLQGKGFVAVKVYSPQVVNEQVLDRFSSEASLCSLLVHPNIVGFHGLCICPPTICLVMERCQVSLEELLLTRFDNHKSSNFMHVLVDVNYMIDATRPIAFLHHFSPPFIHRDIKPANYVLDNEGNLKLTDFGHSRILQRYASGNIGVGSDASDEGHEAAMMTMAGTIGFMAPEIYSAEGYLASYGEKVDIFSLAMTFWDILHPGQDKFPLSRGNMYHIYQNIQNNVRPTLEGVNEKLATLISSAWQTEPSARPTASQVVEELETIRMDLLLVVIEKLKTDMKVLGSKDGQYVWVRQYEITGSDLVELLHFTQVATTKEEAIRVGNSLMECGWLHHSSHSVRFKCNDEKYFYRPEDDEGFQMNREEKSKASESVKEDEVRSSLVATRTEKCPCARLAKRL